MFLRLSGTGVNLYFFSFHLDINECAERKMCKSNEKCINIEGSFRCEAPQCPSGKRLSPDGTRCEGAYHLEYLPIPNYITLQIGCHALCYVTVE